MSLQPRINLSDLVLVEDVRIRLEKLIREQRQLDLLLHHNLNPRRKKLCPLLQAQVKQ